MNLRLKRERYNKCLGWGRTGKATSIEDRKCEIIIIKNNNAKMLIKVLPFQKS